MAAYVASRVLRWVLGLFVILFVTIELAVEGGIKSPRIGCHYPRGRCLQCRFGPTEAMVLA